MTSGEMQQWLINNGWNPRIVGAPQSIQMIIILEPVDGRSNLKFAGTFDTATKKAYEYAITQEPLV
jgi:hypothetical protein